MMAVRVTRFPKVYMAGKIGQNDWRHDLVGPYLRNVRLDYDERSSTMRAATTHLVDGFEYGGPHFISDDHGCYHGPHSHGFGALHWPACGPGNTDDDKLSRGIAQVDGISVHAEWAKSRALVHRSCLRWLREADVIFAWISQYDAYGTLVELGWAAARGTPIFLAFDLMYDGPRGPDSPTSTWNDLWFAEHTATCVTYASSAADAWEEFGDWWAKKMAERWNVRRFGNVTGVWSCHTHRH